MISIFCIKPFAMYGYVFSIGWYTMEYLGSRAIIKNSEGKCFHIGNTLKVEEYFETIGEHKKGLCTYYDGH